MNWSKWLLLMPLGLLFAYLLMFVHPRNDVTIPDGYTVVEYWEKWSANEAAQMQMIVDDFNHSPEAKRDKIFVRYFSMSGVDQKTRVSTAAGVPPDVAGLWDNQITQFGALGALEPLEDLCKEYNIPQDHFKKVYYDACFYYGHLWALPCTPATIALVYNKRIFAENADKLIAAGCDPTRPPRTLDELDRYAAALDEWEKLPDGSKRLKRAGFLPTEPGWYLTAMHLWFGGEIFDTKSNTVTFDKPENLAALTWIRSYADRLGRDSAVNFKSGLGDFRSARNPFYTEEVAMILQGPWMANYIEEYKPSMNRWKMTKEEEKKLPWIQRRDNYEWGAAPFPTSDPKRFNAGYAPMDVLAIPRGAKHKKEAFEFIAYVTRQDVMEKLCSLHCKNSPLTHVSQAYLENHPNPYIDVFDKIADSPYSQGVPPCPIWPDMVASYSAAIDVAYRDPNAVPADILKELQTKYTQAWKVFVERQQERKDRGIK